MPDFDIDGLVDVLFEYDCATSGYYEVPSQEIDTDAAEACVID